MPYLPTLKLCFLHIPKTAGTSIREVLRPLDRKIRFQKGHSGQGRKWVESSLAAEACNKHLTYQELIAATGLPLEDFRVFTIVRNPWSRLVSNFLWGKKQTFKCIHPRALQDFSFYVDVVTTITPLYPAWYDNHWRPQVDFLRGTKEPVIGRFEEPNLDLERVFGILNLPYSKPPHKNRSAKKIDYRSFYNERTKKKVAMLYEEDIDTFHYTFD